MFVYGHKLVAWLAVGAFTLLSLTACSVLSETPFPEISPVTPTKTITAAPFPTNTPHPTITALAVRVTPSVYPPIIAGEDWLTYRNEDLGLNFLYPPRWEIQAEHEIRGSDGFIRLEPFSTQGMGVDAFCQFEVNHGIPQPYGTYPEIRYLYSQGFYGCLVIPSVDADQAGIASAFLWQAEDSDSGIKAEGTRDFIEPVLLSSKSLLPQKQLTIDGNVPSHCRLNELPPQVITAGGLRFESYRLTSAECYQKMEVETFARLLPTEARQKVAVLLELTPAYVEKINQALAPFDYQLKEGRLYHQGEDLFPSALNWVGQPEVNAAQTEFMLPVNSDYGIPQIVTLNGVETVPYHFFSSFGYVPSQVFIGDDLVSVTFDEDRPSQVGDLRHLQVRRNDEIIFTFATLPYGPPGGPVRGLWREGESWLLDLADVFIKDGVILNKTYGYQAIFTYRQINDKPFYFYQQGKDIFISYDGQTLPFTYQEVIHKPSCCSGAMVNMTLGYDGLAFFALQDGFWVYTILTIDE